MQCKYPPLYLLIKFENRPSYTVLNYQLIFFLQLQSVVEKLLPTSTAFCCADIL